MIIGSITFNVKQKSGILTALDKPVNKTVIGLALQMEISLIVADVLILRN